MAVTLLLILVTIVSTGHAFLGPCTVTVTGPPTEGILFERLVDPSCVNGTIEWHYPKGELLVTFEPSRHSSSVCLWHGIGPPVEAVYKMTFNGPERISDPTPSQVSCVDMTNGKVVIKFDETPFLTYMTAYEYRVV